MAKPASVQEFVRAVPLFSSLLPSELDRVAYVMHPMDATAGQALCTEGDEGRDLYVIADGEAIVERGGHSVAKLSVGDYFGELALLDRGPRSATVTAVTDMRLYILHDESFTAVLAELPALAQKLLANLATRLRTAEAHIDHPDLQ